MAKLSLKWKSVANADHIQRMLDLMTANPAAWEDSWDDFIVQHRDLSFAVITQVRKDARLLNRQSAWNTALSSVRAADDSVHNEYYKTIYVPLKDMIVGVEYPGSKFFMCRHAIDAMMSLVTYDDCAYMLYAEPADLLKLVQANNHAAFLMYPACVAFANSKNNQKTR